MEEQLKIFNSLIQENKLDELCAFLKNCDSTVLTYLYCSYHDYAYLLMLEHSKRNGIIKDYTINLLNNNTMHCNIVCYQNTEAINIDISLEQLMLNETK
jgi:hypothetical protein